MLQNDFSTTSDDTYCPLQDITSLDHTKSMMLLSMKLPNNNTIPQTLTKEQFSPRKLCFNASHISDKENEATQPESKIPSIKSWEMFDSSLQTVLPNEEGVT